jgi:hypothetical protein
MRKLCFLFLFALVTSVRAAEFEFLDVDSFLDPFLLEPPKGRLSSKQQKFDYFSSRVYYGAEVNYQYRNDFAEVSSAFVRSANNLYLAPDSAPYLGIPVQLSLDITVRQPFHYRNWVERNKVPTFRTRLEVSFYHEFSLFSKPPTNTTEGTRVRRRELFLGESFWSRGQIGWNMDETRRNRMIHELTLEYEVQIIPKGFGNNRIITSQTGGFLYAWKPELDDHFAGYLVRIDALKWDDDFILRYGIGFGGEARNGRWDWGALRHEFTLEIGEVWKLGTLNAGYGLTQDLPRDKWHHQASVFLNIPVFSTIRTRKD